MFLPSLIFSLLTASAFWLMTRRHPARDPRVIGTVLLLLILLPLLSFLPKVEVRLPEAEASLHAPTLASLLIIWLIGFLIFGLKFCVDHLAMYRWRKQSITADLSRLLEETKTELSYKKDISLRLHPELDSPVVAGLFKPTIYLPESALQWNDNTLKMALLHELSHVQRHDLWMASLARAACLLHWFNPCVWWMRRTLLTQCEFACDTHLLRRGADPKVYALALCDVAESGTAPTLSMAMAGHIPLRQRIQHIVSPKSNRSLLLGGFVLLTSFSAVAMSLVQFVPQFIPAYPASEIELRLNASPFPGDR